MKEKLCGIYSIENMINGKLYVGQSTNIRVRWNLHRSRLNRQVLENAHLQSAWNKYGEDSFQLHILEECTIDELDSREIYWITQLNTMNKEFGYNRVSGGGANRIFSDETKELLRQANLGEKSPMYGRKHSDNTKKLMSIAASGKNNYHFGKKYTEEEKLKIYGSRRGKRKTKEKISCVSE